MFEIVVVQAGGYKTVYTCKDIGELLEFVQSFAEGPPSMLLMTINPK